MDPLDRIAAALERLSPPAPPAADLRAHPAYRWQDGGLTPARGIAVARSVTLRPLALVSKRNVVSMAIVTP